MSDTTHDEEAIFEAARNIADPTERAAYLEKACGGNSALRTRLEALLRANDLDDEFLEVPPTELGGNPSAATASEQLGTQIGPYRLIEQIGRGGMGIVYLAEQMTPVQRQVALKIIKPGMDSESVIHRFEMERQALSVMDHPNIAKVLDAGTTPSGKPYFVMELVGGVPITKYCDEHRLSIRQRLELFVPVCQAVQHAHQKGIIHRDIKPFNILVAEYDGRPVPKVIDFGVAKAIDHHRVQKSLSTQYGQIVGTLEYMSPEQARMKEMDIDTRSDIYSLGAVLYELLSGMTPVDKQRLHSAAFDEALAMIADEEPPVPSQRVSSSDSLPSTAAVRRTDPQRLAWAIRGDLDWIVMKALEKERARRYESAAGLAQDIENYLNDLPVLAGPPSAGYRVRKFIRRHKIAIAATALVALALSVGTGVATWQAVIARQEAARAKRAEAIATAVNDFLTKDLLRQADPEQEPDRDIKLRTVLDRAAAKVHGRFKDQPLVEAAVRDTLGVTYFRLGEFNKARENSERAAKIRQAILGLENRGTLVSMHNLITAYIKLGLYDQAEKRATELLEICNRVLGPRDPDTLSVMNDLAKVHLQHTRFKEAERLYSTIIKRQCDLAGPEDKWTLYYQSNLAALYIDQGRYEDAGTILDKVLQIQQRSLGPDHPNTLSTMSRLAEVKRGRGKYEAAAKLYQRVLAVQRRVLGPEHPDTLTTMLSLALVDFSMGHYKDAETLCKNVLETGTRVLGPEHPQTLNAMVNLGLIYERRRLYDEGERICKQALRSMPRVLGPENATTLSTMRVLASIYRDQRRYEQAEEMLKSILEICTRKYGAEYRATLATMVDLARTYECEHRYEEMLKLYEKVLEIATHKAGAEHPNTIAVMHHVASAHAHLGHFREAQKQFNKALDISRRVLGPEHHNTLVIMNDLGFVCRNLERYDDAEALYRKVLDIQARRHKPEDDQTILALGGLGEVLKIKGRFMELVTLYEDKLKELKDHATNDQTRRLAIARIDNDLAWLLTTCPDRAVRDPKRAATLAAEATRLTPGQGDYWNTLGVAQCCAGAGEAAIEALNKSIQLRSGGDAYDFLGLAMAHWQLGEKEPAKQWYQKGVTWMEKKQPDDEGLERFRLEVAKLLQIDKAVSSEVAKGKRQ